VTRYELAVQGKKIAGSAQRKTSGAFLQHGSILLRPGSERIVRYLRGPATSIDDRVTTLSRETGGGAGERELRAAIVDAFTERFSAAWEPLRFSRADENELRSRAAAKRRESAEFRALEASSP